MEINWAKIIEKPETKYRIEGNLLLKFRINTENLFKELNLLNKKLTNITKQNKQQMAKINELQDQNIEQKATIEDFKKKLDESHKDLKNKSKKIIDQNEIEQKITDYHTVVNQIAERDKKITALEIQLSIKTSQINDLFKKNKELLDQIQRIEKITAETKETKPKLKETQKRLDVKISEISQLNEKIQEMEKQKIEELKTQKKEYEKEISNLKDMIGFRSEEVKTLKDKLRVFLRFSGEDFRYVQKKPEDGIYLILDRQNKKWLLIWDSNTSFIDQRNAERFARSIAKSGWQLADGTRIGIGFKLELRGKKSVPTQLLNDK
ncbi:MAG: coiled-coil domain-containing protein [Promethearchaeota archaeon]